MATGDRQNDNGDQAKAVSPVQTSKSDSDLVRENEEICKDNLQSFYWFCYIITQNSIVNFNYC